jgi:hypothetical protein
VYSLNKRLVLHEIAHALGGPDHREDFAGRLLMLVKHFFGESPARRLRLGFKKHGVKWERLRQEQAEKVTCATKGKGKGKWRK